MTQRMEEIRRRLEEAKFDVSKGLLQYVSRTDAPYLLARVVELEAMIEEMRCGDNMAHTEEARMLRLTRTRVDQGRSKADLARRAQIDQGTLSKIEAGRLLPYPVQLARIAAALGVPPEEAESLLRPAPESTPAARPRAPGTPAAAGETTSTPTARAQR